MAEFDPIFPTSRQPSLGDERPGQILGNEEVGTPAGAALVSDLRDVDPAQVTASSLDIFAQGQDERREAAKENVDALTGLLREELDLYREISATDFTPQRTKTRNPLALYARWLQRAFNPGLEQQMQRKAQATKLRLQTGVLSQINATAAQLRQLDPTFTIQLREAAERAERLKSEAFDLRMAELHVAAQNKWRAEAGVPPMSPKEELAFKNEIMDFKTSSQLINDNLQTIENATKVGLTLDSNPEMMERLKELGIPQTQLDEIINTSKQLHQKRLERGRRQTTPEKNELLKKWTPAFVTGKVEENLDARLGLWQSDAPPQFVQTEKKFEFGEENPFERTTRARPRTITPDVRRQQNLASVLQVFQEAEAAVGSADLAREVMERSGYGVQLQDAINEFPGAEVLPIGRTLTDDEIEMIVTEGAEVPATVTDTDKQRIREARQKLAESAREKEANAGAADAGPGSP
jgi:hypothetical protein